MIANQDGPANGSQPLLSMVSRAMSAQSVATIAHGSLEHTFRRLLAAGY